MNKTTFSKIVYTSARQVGGKILALHEPGVTPNFYAAEIAFRETTVFVLCSVDEVWGFLEIFKPNECRLKFIDCPAMAEVLRDNFSISVVSKTELEGKFEKQSFMSEADINYWRPKTLGEGLFNWWD